MQGNRQEELTGGVRGRWSGKRRGWPGAASQLVDEMRQPWRRRLRTMARRTVGQLGLGSTGVGEEDDRDVGASWTSSHGVGEVMVAAMTTTARRRT